MLFDEKRREWVFFLDPVGGCPYVFPEEIRSVNYSSLWLRPKARR